MTLLNGLSPEELELAALATLREPANVRYAVQQGVDEYAFQVDEYAKVWNYLVARSTMTETVSVEDVRTVCGVELPEGLTDRETLIEALVNLSTYRRASAAAVRRMETVSDHPAEGSREMLTELIAELSDLGAKGKGSHIGYYAGGARARLAEVKARAERVETGGMVGLHTGLKLFDGARDGWQAGDLVAFIGALNVGKSFMLTYSAACAWHYDKAKVLFISPESKRIDVEFRLDAISARLDARSLSNRAIRRGTIDFIDYEKHVEALETRLAEGAPEWITVDQDSVSGFTVDDIISLAREHRPDLLVIDGFHLIHIPTHGGGEGGKSWEVIKAAADRIKVAGQALNMAVLAGSQATRSAVMAPGDAPALGESAYGMGLVEAANRVVSLAAKPGNSKMRVFKVTKNRDDEVPPESFYLRFDVDTGDIAQLDADEHQDGTIAWQEE